MGWLSRNFGTLRGAVRLVLAHGEAALGQAGVRAPAPGEVRRLVFVCHGNICRSAYADMLARKAGLNAASFGLSTSTGKQAWPLVREIAARRGHDLESHRTTDLADFEPQQGDYLLGMEARHLRKMAANPRLAHLPRGLLGNFCAPAFPLLYDPYQLDPEYMEVCLTRIENAVARLAAEFPELRG